MKMAADVATNLHKWLDELKMQDGPVTEAPKDKGEELEKLFWAHSGIQRALHGHGD